MTMDGYFYVQGNGANHKKAADYCHNKACNGQTNYMIVVFDHCE